MAIIRMPKSRTGVGPKRLAALAIGLLAAWAPSVRAQPERRSLPIPPGYNYPANAAALEAMIAARDTAGLRRHSWNLWAGINQPGENGWPIWRSWEIPTQVFAEPSPALATGEPEAAARSLIARNVANHPEINLPLPVYAIPPPVAERYKDALAKHHITLAANIPDGDNFQNNGDLMLVSEAFDQQAAGWIRNRDLYLSATLTRLLRDGNRDIPAMPGRSVVLKHMYWPVTKDGLTALPVADMALYETPAVPDTTYVGFENQARWSRAVAIDPNRTTIPPNDTASVTYLYGVSAPANPNGLAPPDYGPHTYPNAAVVPISAFYYKKLSMAEFQALSVFDRLLIDASFWWVHQRMFEDGDYLVSVASHVVTKETPGWTLQTFWWSDRPDEGRYAADRPTLPNAKGPWRHYLANTEDGVTKTPGGGDLPIVYNPYVELASHPVQTNCRNCHIRAATPGASYMQNPGPAALANIKPGNAIFAKKLRTDFLWTIPDRAN